MKNRHEKNFTLVELLVVIGIIALLAALLFPAISSVRGHAKKVKAQAVITGLKTAITQYEAQYGILPFAYGTDKILLPGTNDAEYDALIELLSCVNVNTGSEAYNARKTRFLTGLPSSGSTDSERTLTDPYKLPGQKYGTRLAIAVDLDGTNKISWSSDGTSAPDGDETDDYDLNGKIFIWSLGEDGKNQWGFSKSSGDDVPSWE